MLYKTLQIDPKMAKAFIMMRESHMGMLFGCGFEPCVPSFHGMSINTHEEREESKIGNANGHDVTLQARPLAVLYPDTVVP